MQVLWCFFIIIRRSFSKNLGVQILACDQTFRNIREYDLAAWSSSRHGPQDNDSGSYVRYAETLSYLNSVLEDAPILLAVSRLLPLEY